MVERTAKEMIHELKTYGITVMPEEAIDYRKIFDQLFMNHSKYSVVVSEKEGEISATFNGVVVYRESWWGKFDKNEIWKRLINAILSDAIDKKTNDYNSFNVSSQSADKNSFDDKPIGGLKEW